MNYKRFLGAASAALIIVIAIALALTSGAWAQSKYKTLYKFKGGKDGGALYGSLIFDPAGNLYGMTPGDFSSECTVFELARNTDGGWTKSVLYDLGPPTNCEGGNYWGGYTLIFDHAGNLYGTTSEGGSSHCGNYGCGTVFELTPNPDGSWTENLLHSFMGGADSSSPSAGLIFDSTGNLYGTTASGYDDGTVYKLTPNPDGSWTKSLLYAFQGGNDGWGPFAGLIFDPTGNLYGTTLWGGNSPYCSGGGCGTVFELTPNPDGSWKEKVLHRFHDKDGGFPIASLILDSTGNLYGTTSSGGRYEGGVVFKLTPNPDGRWKEKTLHHFTRTRDGRSPNAGLIIDGTGNLYGTTEWGGNLDHCNPSGCGVVFKLAPTSNGGWKESVLHTFIDHPGTRPDGGLMFDAAGNLYGTTFGDSTVTFGSVFEITP